jgi:hypothetical protein
LDKDVERAEELLLISFLAGTGFGLGLLHRLVGRKDRPLLRRLLLRVRPIIAEVEAVVLLLRRLLFLVSSELRIQSHKL